MMDNVKVSILIPVYNRINIVHLAVDSALRQTYDDYEVIICDNCSTDGTYEYLCEKYGNESKVHIYRNVENIGPVGNWITCFKKSNGQYIKYLWSDDRIAADFLEKTVQALESDPDVGMVLTNVSWDNLESDRESKGYKLWIKKVVNKLWGNWIHKYDGYYWGDTGKYGSNIFIYRVYEGVKSYPVSASCALIRRDCLEIVPEIENSFGVQLGRTGAGTDVLMLLATFKKYSCFYYLDKKEAFLGFHNGSFTVQNSLDYEYWVAQGFYLESVLKSKNKYNDYRNLFMRRILFLYKENGKEILRKLFVEEDLSFPSAKEVDDWGKEYRKQSRKRKIAYFWRLT